MQRLLGKMDRSSADVLVRVKSNLLEHRGKARDLHFPMAAGEGVPMRAVKGVEHLHGHRCQRVGVVVDVDGTDVRLLLIPVQPIDVVLRALMQVHGLFVQQHRRGELVHLADDLRARLRRVDDHDVVGEDAAQVHLLGRKGLAAPEPATRRSGRRTVFLEDA